MELCSDPKVKICPLPVRRDAFAPPEKNAAKNIENWQSPFN